MRFPRVTPHIKNSISHEFQNTFILFHPLVLSGTESDMQTVPLFHIEYFAARDTYDIDTCTSLKNERRETRKRIIRICGKVFQLLYRSFLEQKSKHKQSCNNAYAVFVFTSLKLRYLLSLLWNVLYTRVTVTNTWSKEIFGTNNKQT